MKSKYPGHCCWPISIMGYLHSCCQPIRQRYGWQRQAIRKLNCQACTFWTNPASLSQFRTAAAIRFACHWTTNVMHWAGALSFGGASRGFVSLLEKWLYHGIIAPCGSFQTCPVAKPWMITIGSSFLKTFHINSRVKIRLTMTPSWYYCTANAYRQTTDKLMFKSVISTVRWIIK